MKPLIAVILHTGMNHNNFFSHVQPVDYTAAVEAAGGIPYLVPFTSRLDLLPEMLAPASGCLFTGGRDICPLRYGEEKKTACDETSNELDAYQFAAFDIVLARNLPMLGICRGLQLINTGLGGSLYQDIFTECCSEYSQVLHHFDKDPQKENLHPIEIEEGSFLSNIFGRTVVTNSYHHQAVRVLGQGLIAAACTGDGVIEALQHNNRPIYAVQWHPERMVGHHLVNMLPLFTLLVEQACHRERG